MSEENVALARVMAAYREQREDGDPTRTEMGFILVLTVPSRMTTEDVERDLKRSIEFGQPVLSILYDVPAPRRIEDVQDSGERL